MLLIENHMTSLPASLENKSTRTKSPASLMPTLKSVAASSDLAVTHDVDTVIANRTSPTFRDLHYIPIIKVYMSCCHSVR